MEMQLELMQSLKHIRLVATDCDGVLTDGGMYYTASGDQIKRFHSLDGMGFVRLHAHGIRTAVITGDDSPILRQRMKKLPVDDLLLSTVDKLEALEKLCEKYSITMQQIAYIGDDCYDLAAITACGFGCVPASAFEAYKQQADYVTVRAGGHGCFREIAEIILSNGDFLI